MNQRTASLPTFVLLAVAICPACSSFADEPKVPTTDLRLTFDDPTPENNTKDWLFKSTHPGKSLATWAVVADPGAPSRPNVLTITKTENTGSTYNVAMRAGSSFKDVDLSVRLRPNSGKEDQGGGLIWRCKDENNYYICRVNPLEDNFRVYKVVDGKRTQLKTADCKAKVGQWYTIRAVMTGPHVECYLDGRKLLEADDSTFDGRGMVGLWTKADAASSFDDFVVKEIGRGPAEEKRASATGEADWKTLAESSNYDRTGSYADAVAFYQRVADACPWVNVQNIGMTGERREMTLVVASKDKAFTPEAARKTGKAILLIVNGVHSGEIEGKDASMALLREICITRKLEGLLDHVVLLVLPVFNIDGHERVSPYNRINQNGPREMGWRCTARNLNLNRDYMKADCPEMRALLTAFHSWLPDLWFDTHTTDGADFQYDVTFGAGTGPENAPSVSAYVNDRLHPYLLKKLAEDGHTPMLFFDLRDRMDPSKGIETNLGFAPRFSTGYGAIANRPSILVETHMLKPYKVRVLATYDLLRRTLELVNADPDALRAAVREGDEYSAAISRNPARKVVLATTQPADDAGVPMVFKAYAVSEKPSIASGAKYLVWDHDKPIDVATRMYGSPAVVREVSLPDSYVVPPQWTDVIDRLELHGLRLERISHATSMEIGSYRFSDVHWKDRPFEGRHEVSFRVEPIRETRLFPAGSVIVRLEDRTARLAAHLLEPEAPDSLVHWGFFDSIFEQKEYYEDYAMAPIGDRLLSEDAGLRASFEAWLKSNPEKAANGRARLDFLFQRSPWWDQRKDVYPVGRVERAGDDRPILGR